jgi:small subunit ribosomal protein S13
MCEDAKVEPTKKAGELSQEELIKLRDEISKYLTEGDLRREVNMNIKTKMEINSYQGSRHKKGLPVRGQRTITNARTRKGKGKTIANKKKA